MRALSPTEARKWCEAQGVTLASDGFPAARGKAKSFSIPVDAGRRVAMVAQHPRPKEPRGIGKDHGFLLAERCREPDREMVGAVMMVVELREELPAHAPGGLAPRELFGGVGKGEADRAQPVDGRRARRPRATASSFRRSSAALHRRESSELDAG